MGAGATTPWGLHRGACALPAFKWEPILITLNYWSLYCLLRKCGRVISNQPTLLFIFKNIFIYLAAPGPSCGMWDLFPWPGMEPMPPELGVWSLNHWTMREVPKLFSWKWCFRKPFIGNKIQGQIEGSGFQTGFHRALGLPSLSQRWVQRSKKKKWGIQVPYLWAKPEQLHLPILFGEAPGIILIKKIYFFLF